MFFTTRCVAAATILACGVYAFPQAVPTSNTTQAPTTTTAASLPSSSETGSPCALVSSLVGSQLSAQPSETPYVVPSVALACVNSVALNTTASLDFLDFLVPYLELQVTYAYLKSPPEGYTLPGVDLVGGIEEIRQKLTSGEYQNQWAFESELHTLINVLPHDFHFVFNLPLTQLFRFATLQRLVSVSNENGTSIPKVYLKDDWDVVVLSNGTSTFQPSAIITIDGTPVADALQSIGESTSNYNDPDAIYNTLFLSLASTGVLGQGAQFYAGGFTLGLNDNFTYQFENGTSRTFPNVALVQLPDSWEYINSGETLYDFIEVSPPQDEASSTSSSFPTTTPIPTSTNAAATPTTTTSLEGYPTPAIIHPLGFTSGYFLDDGTAVLAINSFQAEVQDQDLVVEASQQQQQLIKDFLALCRQRHAPQIVIDLSGNGGGIILNGYDAFNQFFPNMTAYGGARYRTTPAIEYLGALVEISAGPHDTENSTYFSTQRNLNEDLEDFSSWQELGGPYSIMNDSMTAIVRVNQSIYQTIYPAGYGNNTEIAPQPFQPENMVMLMDGTCGSTCSIFAELMKTQGQVRSIAVGGRPTNNAMQYVGGSKASLRAPYGQFQAYLAAVSTVVSSLSEQNITAPPLPSTSLLPSLSLPPLGNQSIPTLEFSSGTSNGFYSGKNAYSSSNPDLPLQFTYEAANCRLWYTIIDIYDISSLWKRVVDTAWGNGTCVEGSTVSDDGRIGDETKGYDVSVFSRAVIPDSPGLVRQGPNGGNGTGTGTGTGTGSGSGNGNGTTTPGSTAPAQPNAAVAARGMQSGSVVMVFAALVGMFVLV